MDKFIAHILVVDDDDGIRSLVKKYLNENNFLVTTADNAENASEKIKIIKFDLIILDIMMPGKSGLEFIKENQKKMEMKANLSSQNNKMNDVNKELGQAPLLARVPFLEFQGIHPKGIVKRLMNIDAKLIEQVNYTFDNSVDQATNAPSPRIIKSHLPLEFLPPNLLAKVRDWV